MKEKLQPYIIKVVAWLREWNEIMILPIMFVLLLLSTPFFRLFVANPMSVGSFDIGILQTPIVAGFGFAFGTALCWFIYKLSWPKLAQWVDDSMERRLSNPSTNPDYDNFYFKKAQLGIVVYFAYLAGYCWILSGLLK